MNDLIEQIRKDREAGTKGKWFYRGLINWLTYRRFNYIDATVVAYAVHLGLDAKYGTALVVCAIGTGLSVTAESFSGLNTTIARRVYRAPEMEDRIDEQAHHIELLDSELREAVRVAYGRGAIRWARLNYPKLVAEIEKGGA